MSSTAAIRSCRGSPSSTGAGWSSGSTSTGSTRPRPRRSSPRSSTRRRRPTSSTQIHRRSDGNPFFVEELLGAGADAEGGRLPPTLREVLLARIVALPECAQTVIGVAAVAGGRVDHDLLAHVAGLADEATCSTASGTRSAARSSSPAAGRDGARRLRVPPRAAPGGRL